jgi:AcrR family transcriptional regulator
MATAERAYHHGTLRAALLEQAERMLAARGASELSLRELAREVGVSHAAPRRHFADRQALLDALAEQGFADLQATLAAARDAGDDFETRLAAIARAYVGFATRHAALLDLMFAAKHEPDAARLREAADAAFAVPLGLLSAGIAAGDISGEDPERAGIVVFAAIQGLAALVNGGMVPAEGLEAVVDGAVAQLLRGLRGP